MGMLEATPHNTVHNTIAGDMATMLSPRDPIFFLHHANIDQIWASWNRQGGVNPTDTAWRNRTFANNFARANGSLYSIAVRNTLERRGVSLRQLRPRTRLGAGGVDIFARGGMDPGRDRRSPDRSA